MVQSKTAEARSYLCYEAASLYSLKQRRKRGGLMEYYIGGNPVPGLLDLAGESAASGVLPGAIKPNNVDDS